MNYGFIHAAVREVYAKHKYGCWRNYNDKRKNDRRLSYEYNATDEVQWNLMSDETKEAILQELESNRNITDVATSMYWKGGKLNIIVPL